jgi:hypothetical protein
MVMKTSILNKINGALLRSLLIFSVIGLVFSFTADAATVYTSAKSGTWDGSGVWSSSGSGTPYTYIIASGHTVTLDVDPSSSDTKEITLLQIKGTLDVDEYNLELNQYAMVQVWSGGTVTMDSRSGKGLIKFESQSCQIGSPRSTAGFWDGGDCSWTNDSSLPVSLLGFESKTMGASVLLTWQTASEIDNSYFEVQRSDNGGEFLPIGRIEGSGTKSTLSEYQFMDMAPFSNAMYRLKMVDFDGSAEYSLMIESPWIESLTGVKNMFVVSSSDIGGPQGIQLNNIPEDLNNVQVISPSGIQLFNQQYADLNEFDYNVLTLSNLSMGSAGIYYVVVSTHTDVTTLKFIVK